MENNNPHSNLEESLAGEEEETQFNSVNQNNPSVQISREEEIGIHKGALNTLLAERNELIKMISNVEVIMQAHISRLKELGVEIKMQAGKEE